MQIAMVGLGRMGANMVQRLTKGGHQCVVFDQSQDTVQKVAGQGATGSTSMKGYGVEAAVAASGVADGAGGRDG